MYGCCPGGGMSNNWTILFDGDLNLSAIMTFISNAGSMGKSGYESFLLSKRIEMFHLPDRIKV